MVKTTVETQEVETLYQQFAPTHHPQEEYFQLLDPCTWRRGGGGGGGWLKDDKRLRCHNSVSAATEEWFGSEYWLNNHSYAQTS